jgi:hypothetical protein
MIKRKENRAVKILLRALLAWALFVLGISAGISVEYAKQGLPIVIHTSFGGDVEEFLDSYEDKRDTGRPVKVTGTFCISACTLVLSVMPKERLCSDPNTQFGFHSATVQGKFAPGPSRSLFHTYPQALQDKLRSLGVDPDDPTIANHPDVIFIQATELAKIGVINLCKENT